MRFSFLVVKLWQAPESNRARGQGASRQFCIRMEGKEETLTNRGVLHPRDAFHACHECRRFAPAARPSVKRLLFAVFPAVRKNVRCPNLLSLLLLVFCSSFRAASVCEFACPVSSFLWAIPFQAGETCLLQNMDFSCCSARGGIEPPLLA